MQVIYVWYVLIGHELNRFKLIELTFSGRIFVLIITYNNNLFNIRCYSMFWIGSNIFQKM